MVNYFVSSLITWWEQSPSDMKHALDYFDILVRAAVFGEIQSKGKRLGFSFAVEGYLTLHCLNINL